MPDFKSKEEYEQWKTQRLKEAQGKKQAALNTPEQAPKESAGQKESAEPKEGEKEEVPKNSPQDSPKTQKAVTTKTGLTDIGGLFRNSWEIYKKRFAVLIALYFFSLFALLAVIALFGGAGFLLSLIFSSIKGPLIAIMVFAGITAGTVVICWGLAAVVFAVADEGLGFKDALVNGWQRVSAFIWFFSISGFIITGGFLLFIIPGIIFLVWFAFGQFILADKNERGMNALLKSKAYVKGHWFEVFLSLFVVWIVSAFIGIIPFIGPFLAIAFMPFMMIFVNLIYEDLKTMKGDIAYSSSSGEKFKWIGAGTLGYIVLPVIIILIIGASLSIPLFLLKGMLK